MSLQLQPVQVATASSDTEGQLVLAGEFLVAVLVRLSDDHGVQADKWFLEQGCGRVDHASPPLFGDLDEVQAWIAWRLLSPR